MVMDVNEIKQYLPHRYPFLLVDRVTEIELGKSIVAYKNITVNEPYFLGHFPDHPIFPGVLIIEAMAQAAGVLGFKTVNKLPKDGHLYYFVGSEKTRFKRPVVPGDRLTLEAKVLRERRGIWVFACRSHVDGELVCETEITCAEKKV